jgi:hypothetical protein
MRQIVATLTTVIKREVLCEVPDEIEVITESDGSKFIVDPTPHRLSGVVVFLEPSVALKMGLITERGI